MQNRTDVLRRLIDGTRRSEPDLSARVRSALDTGYWRSLCRSMNVGGSSIRSARSTSPAVRLSAEARRRLAARFREEGYVAIDRVFPRRLIANMRAAVVTVKSAGWPPVFAFVYDEFWTVWQFPLVTRFVGDVLGSPVHMRARVWTYYVHSVRGARGWPPHAEEHGTRGLSIWIPLTDATLDNGCIYVVPKDLIAARVNVADVFRAREVDLETASTLLHASRAVPAAAGSMLAWDFDVIHWGSVVHRAVEPRISISAEFVPPPSGPLGAPLVRRVDRIPSFRDRVRTIAANIRSFAKNDAWTMRDEDLGDALQNEITGGA